MLCAYIYPLKNVQILSLKNQKENIEDVVDIEVKVEVEVEIEVKVEVEEEIEVKVEVQV